MVLTDGRQIGAECRGRIGRRPEQCPANLANDVAGSLVGLCEFLSGPLGDLDRRASHLLGQREVSKLDCGGGGRSASKRHALHQMAIEVQLQVHPISAAAVEFFWSVAAIAGLVVEDQESPGLRIPVNSVDAAMKRCAPSIDNEVRFELFLDVLAMNDLPTFRNASSLDFRKCA